MDQKTILSALCATTLALSACAGAPASSASSASSEAETPASVVSAETPASSEATETPATPATAAEAEVSKQRTTSQVLSPEEPTSVDRGGSDRWAYTITTYPSEISYQFTDVQVTIPSTWDGKYEIVQDGNSVYFYHKASREAWEAKGVQGGVLFSVNFSPDTSYQSLPSYCDLGSTAEGYYFLAFPTDMQGYEPDASISSEYLSMSKDSMYIRNNSWVSSLS